MNDDLTRRFADVMDAITRTNNTTSLADLARRAGELWEELQSRTDDLPADTIDSGNSGTGGAGWLQHQKREER